MKKVLIAGGTGLVGTHLCTTLQRNGYEVSLLSRNPHADNTIRSFRWDLNAGYIDKEALTGQDYIINLSGANVGGKRWNKKYKEEILSSRVDSAKLLFDALQHRNLEIKKYISSSATGIYPDSDEIMHENHEAGNHFLAEVCKRWESEAMKFGNIGVPVSIIRTGIVLTEEGGFLEKMALPVKCGLGGAAGRGKQYISWIHIDDLCSVFLFLLREDAPAGIFNAAAPEAVTNKEMVKSIGKALHRPVFLPNIPGFILKLLLGEMAENALASNRVSPEKLLKEGFRFKYPTLTEALEDIYQI